MNIFKEEYSVDDKLVYKLYTADVWAVSLGREVRVVIVDYLDTGKKTQARKVFFSTDLTLSARDIFDLYRTRSQLEFVFRDAKQFTGLTHCQARNKEALAFAFNASLSSVNVARAYARQQGHNLSVGSNKTLLHNAAMETPEVFLVTSVWGNPSSRVRHERHGPYYETTRDRRLHACHK